MDLYLHSIYSDTAFLVAPPHDVFALVGVKAQGSYGPWNPDPISRTPGCTYLMRDGSNILSLLDTYATGSHEEFDWVVDQFYKIRGKAISQGHLIKYETSLLCSLMALVIDPFSDFVILDQPENGVPPFMLKALVQAIRERCTQIEVKVGFITTSPVILNEFDKTPESVLVGNSTGIWPLPTLYEADWLKNFTLGNVYMENSYVKAGQ